MGHDESKAKRGPDGKFLPGHTPPKSPGRPPGANGVKARAAKLAGERLEQMLGRATEVIEAELEDGNAQVATWLVDRIRPPGRSDYVRLAEDIKLGTIREIVAASESTAVAASEGVISVQDAKGLQEVLVRHAQIKGLEELAKLREELDEMRKSSAQTALIDRSHVPEWGKLRDSGS